MNAFLNWAAALLQGVSEDGAAQLLCNVLLLLLALAECIGGWRILRWQIGACGALAGGMLGFAIARQWPGFAWSLPGALALLVVIAGAVAGALLGMRLYRFGVFCVGFTVVCCGALLWGVPVIASLIAGLAAGALAAALLRPAVTVCTALGGGALFCRTALLWWAAAPGWVQPAGTVLLAVIGCIVQWKTAPEQQKSPLRKKSAKKD